MAHEMTYVPRSVPLPEPVNTDKIPSIVRDNIAYRIYNLLSIAANCMEEYENPKREHFNDAGTKGNLSEFEGCLISAIAHWLFMFEAESLLGEEAQAELKKNIESNAIYMKSTRLPSEPTEAMIQAGMTFQDAEVYKRSEIINIWRDMAKAFVQEQPR